MREVQGQGGAAGHAGREAEGGGGGGGEHWPLQGVGGRGVAVVEVQRAEHRGVWRQCHAPRPRPRPGPAEAHGAIHLLERGHVARLLQQLDAHRRLPLPLGPATRGHALTLHSAQYKYTEKAATWDLSLLKGPFQDLRRIEFKH